MKTKKKAKETSSKKQTRANGARLLKIETNSKIKEACESLILESDEMKAFIAGKMLANKISDKIALLLLSRLLNRQFQYLFSYYLKIFSTLRRRALLERLLKGLLDGSICKFEERDEAHCFYHFKDADYLSDCEMIVMKIGRKLTTSEKEKCYQNLIFYNPVILLKQMDLDRCFINAYKKSVDIYCDKYSPLSDGSFTLLQQLISIAGDLSEPEKLKQISRLIHGSLKKVGNIKNKEDIPRKINELKNYVDEVKSSQNIVDPYWDILKTLVANEYYAEAVTLVYDYFVGQERIQGMRLIYRRAKIIVKIRILEADCFSAQEKTRKANTLFSNCLRLKSGLDYLPNIFRIMDNKNQECVLLASLKFLREGNTDYFMAIKRSLSPDFWSEKKTWLLSNLRREELVKWFNFFTDDLIEKSIEYSGHLKPCNRFGKMAIDSADLTEGALKQTNEISVKMFMQSKKYGGYLTLPLYFTSISFNLEKLVLTQEQIVVFCKKYHNSFNKDGYGTLFLFKENNKFFVSCVERIGEILETRRYRLGGNQLFHSHNPNLFVVLD